jgi:hypothetical protein
VVLHTDEKNVGDEDEAPPAILMSMENAPEFPPMYAPALKSALSKRKSCWWGSVLSGKAASTTTVTSYEAGSNIAQGA